MVTHRRRRSILTAFALYILAAAFIGYFAVNAFTGNHGLRAQQDLEQQMASIKDELDGLKSERAEWEQRVSLLEEQLHSMEREQQKLVEENDFRRKLEAPMPRSLPSD